MPRRVLEGKVVSDKMDKTVTVSVERRFMHPKYKKYIRKTTKYAAHDETNAVKEGDTVQIIECAPISKRKTWTVIQGDAPAPVAKKEAPKKEEKAEVKKAPAKKATAKKTTAKKAPAKKAAKKTTKKTEDKK